MVKITTKKTFKKYIVDKICKHQSYSRLRRYYLIQYKSDKTFLMETYDDCDKTGETTGTYRLKQTKSELKMYVNYDQINESPYEQSTFNKNNKNSIYKTKKNKFFNMTFQKDKDRSVSLFYYNSQYSRHNKKLLYVFERNE